MKRKLNIIEKLDSDHLVVRDYNNNSILIMKKHMENYQYSPNSKLNEKYHSNVIIDNEKYEALELFSPYDKKVATSILISLKEINQPINSSINKILDTLKTFRDNVSLQIVRGTFGELFALKNFKISHKDSETSIYDFKDEYENDLEIKTFSKVLRTINLSYQQLTNNKEAIVYSLEVYETSKGSSIKELLETLPNEIQDRYEWIKKTNSKMVNEKFKAGELIVKKISEFSKGLVMPELALDASFKFKV